MSRTLELLQSTANLFYPLSWQPRVEIVESFPCGAMTIELSFVGGRPALLILADDIDDAVRQIEDGHSEREETMAEEDTKPIFASDVFDIQVDGLLKQMENALEWHQRRSPIDSAAGAALEVAAICRQLQHLADAVVREQERGR